MAREAVTPLLCARRSGGGPINYISKADRSQQVTASPSHRPFTPSHPAPSPPPCDAPRLTHISTTTYTGHALTVKPNCTPLRHSRPPHANAQPHPDAPPTPTRSPDPIAPPPPPILFTPGRSRDQQAHRNVHRRRARAGRGVWGWPGSGDDDVNDRCPLARGTRVGHPRDIRGMSSERVTGRVRRVRAVRARARARETESRQGNHIGAGVRVDGVRV